MRMLPSGSLCQILQHPAREQLRGSCQGEVRDPPLPCASGPALRTWFNAEIIKPDLSVFSLLLAPTARASQGLVLCLWPWLPLEQLSWDLALGQVLPGPHCRAPSSSAWPRCPSCCQLSGPMPAEGISSSSCGHIPSWLLSNLPPKRRISLKAGLSCRCCASLRIAQAPTLCSGADAAAAAVVSPGPPLGFRAGSVPGSRAAWGCPCR